MSYHVLVILGVESVNDKVFCSCADRMEGIQRANNRVSDIHNHSSLIHDPRLKKSDFQAITSSLFCIFTPLHYNSVAYLWAKNFLVTTAQVNDLHAELTQVMVHVTEHVDRVLGDVDYVLEMELEWYTDNWLFRVNNWVLVDHSGLIKVSSSFCESILDGSLEWKSFRQASNCNCITIPWPIS